MIVLHIAGTGFRWALVVRLPLLCACTFASSVKELRGAEMTWDKAEKTGRVAMPA